MTTVLPVGLTGPISGWMTIWVAFDTFQLSCQEVPPRWLAVKLITGLLAVVCGGWRRDDNNRRRSDNGTGRVGGTYGINSGFSR